MGVWERWNKNFRRCTIPRFTLILDGFGMAGSTLSVGNGEFTGNVQTVAEVLPWLQAAIATKYNVERKGRTIT